MKDQKIKEMIKVRMAYDMYVGDWGTGGGGSYKPKEPIIEIVYEKIGDPSWIKIEDELPAVGEDVWVYRFGASVGVRAHLMSQEEKDLQSEFRKSIDNGYQGNWWHDVDIFFPMNDVTHWMPLPKPPKK